MWTIPVCSTATRYDTNPPDASKYQSDGNYLDSFPSAATGMNGYSVTTGFKDCWMGTGYKNSTTGERPDWFGTVSLGTIYWFIEHGLIINSISLKVAYQPTSKTQSGKDSQIRRKIETSTNFLQKMLHEFSSNRIRDLKHSVSFKDYRLLYFSFLQSRSYTQSVEQLSRSTYIFVCTYLRQSKFLFPGLARFLVIFVMQLGGSARCQSMVQSSVEECFVCYLMYFVLPKLFQVKGFLRLLRLPNTQHLFNESHQFTMRLAFREGNYSNVIYLKNFIGQDTLDFQVPSVLFVYFPVVMG